MTTIYKTIYLMLVPMMLINCQQETIMMVKNGSSSNTTHRCNMSINVTSSEYLKNNIEVFQPDFARLELRFRYEHPVVQPYILEPSSSHTNEIIQPYNWIWTYYLPTGFFSYIRWPVDFPILSFGLLDAKTLKHQFLVVEIPNQNCSVLMGNRDTIRSIAYALKNMTRDYLVKLMEPYSYSYWCYLAEVPGVKNTWSYQFGIYLAYPVEFARYNCCRTEKSKVDYKEFSIRCPEHQLGKMWQATVFPYVMGIVAFCYFPIVLFNFGAGVSSIGKKKRTRQIKLIAAAEDDNDEQEYTDDWIFLDGKPPINLKTVVFGLFGLVETYPVCVSRLRRFVFVIMSPWVIFCKLYVYYTFQYDTTMALLEHGCPMGYLSILGGFEKSRQNFMPVLGGPYCLLIIFYVASFIFFILPTYPDGVVFDGTLRYSSFGESSPLFLDISTVEKYSHLLISQETCGYRRAAIFNTALFYSLFNPKFWRDAVNLQFSRFQTALYSFKSLPKQIIFSVFGLPIYVVICFLELLLCITYYGIPVINAVCIIVTGFVIWLLKFLRQRNNRSARSFRTISNSYPCKFILASCMACLFVYYMFSFCTIFILSFAFICQLLVFSFISVIVYPSFSFGYLFFGVVFIYYIFKIFQGVGDRYIELLADAVEISSQMDADVCRNQIIDGTVIIDVSVPVEITKIQISNSIINLSSNQRHAIREISIERRPKIMYRDHAAGIPYDLFQILVRKYLPLHVQMIHAFLKILIILVLLYLTISMVDTKPNDRTEGISEMMHVVFIVAIGSLPRVLEVATDNTNHHVKKELHLRHVKETVNTYWTKQFQH